MFGIGQAPLLGLSFFLRGCAEIGDQREPRSHAGRRVRPGAEAVRSGAWGGPNQRFGMSKRIFRNIAGLRYRKFLITYVLSECSDKRGYRRKIFRNKWQNFENVGGTVSPIFLRPRHRKPVTHFLLPVLPIWLLHVK